ncbi:MAG: hypothetical protein CVV17_08360 [Gammaproteobacteria bacterium HGW-Gammaproteobacteria-7]|nr:MAG: hypothetical protein CVV17_08360 [Gammaproteobacteria bacterium HGW-Gammaproteobacteria-7]
MEVTFGGVLATGLKQGEGIFPIGVSCESLVDDHVQKPERRQQGVGAQRAAKPRSVAGACGDANGPG